MMETHKHKRWAESSRLSQEYLNGVEQFLNFAFEKKCTDGKISCPCQRCVLHNRLNRAEAYDHLVVNGIMPSYDKIFGYQDPIMVSIPENSSPVEHETHKGDSMFQMLQDVFGLIGEHVDMDIDRRRHIEGNEEGSSEQCVEGYSLEEKGFENLIADANIELYPGCKKFTRLSFILHIYHMKCLYGWSNKSFSMLLNFLKDVFPDGSSLPNSFYETKKIIKTLGLSYEKIHACPNDCMLFWKEKAMDEVCCICGESRWKSHKNGLGVNAQVKEKKIPVKVLRYFPLKPRLKRLFMSSKTSQLMRWHKEDCIKDGVMRHPVDSEAWKSLDSRYPDFAIDPRNVRLGLASDGFNPFGAMKSTYSMWPVILLPYNLPPWLCMKQSNFILSLLIPGSVAPGNNIDVYLQPLVQELKELWVVGVETYDALAKETFRMRAALLWTINDFPGYGNLSGWCTYGAFSCPCCNIHTHSRWLRHSRKYCYLGHRRFIDIQHQYRHEKNSFDGTEEFGLKPAALSGSDVLDQLESIKFTFGKIHADVSGVMEGTWRKKSIFFELPYWEYNMLRHNLDVMHIKSNVCKNLINTLLDIDKKSKDNLKSRLDLKEMKIRRKLWPKPRGSRKTRVRLACFTLSPLEKRRFYEVLGNVKFPYGYATNISRCVHKNKKLSGLKSHDHHVLMQHLLPLAIRGALPLQVRSVLIDLCSFFRALCAKSLHLLELEQLEANIAIILCQMEKIFPPSFFTISVHLMVHLAAEARIGGPVHYRWMYPIERYLSTLKSYVRNKACPEGSIAEAYIAQECLTFCGAYLEKTEANTSIPMRNQEACEVEMQQGSSLFPTMGQPYGKIEAFIMDEKMQKQAHRYVLFNIGCNEIESLRGEHIREIKRQHRRRRLSQLEIDRIHGQQFHEWLKEHVNDPNNIEDGRITNDVKILAQGPMDLARRFKAFDMHNGYKFRTEEYEMARSTQNSGVMVVAKTQSYASTSDKRPTFGDVTYYGVLRDIVELSYYGKFKIVLFKCDWVDVTHGTGIKKDDSGFTLVSFSHLIHRGNYLNDEPFIFSSQAQQVVFVQDRENAQWFVPLAIKPRNTFEMGNAAFECNIEIEMENEFANAHEEEETNDNFWVRSDLGSRLIDTHENLTNASQDVSDDSSQNIDSDSEDGH